MFRDLVVSWAVRLRSLNICWARSWFSGSFTCRLGSPGKDAATKVLAVLGIAAGAFAVLALVTGSLTALSLLTADFVLLWAASVARHSHQPIPA